MEEAGRGRRKRGRKGKGRRRVGGRLPSGAEGVDAPESKVTASQAVKIVQIMNILR